MKKPIICATAPLVFEVKDFFFPIDLHDKSIGRRGQSVHYGVGQSRLIDRLYHAATGNEFLILHLGIQKYILDSRFQKVEFHKYLANSLLYLWLQSSELPYAIVI